MQKRTSSFDLSLRTPNLDREKYDALIDDFLCGDTIDFQDSSPEVFALAVVLDGDGVFFPGQDKEFDSSDSVFYSRDLSIAICTYNLSYSAGDPR